MSGLSFNVEDPAAPEVHDLIAQLDRYQTDLYPPESNHLLPLEGLRQPNVVFLAARLDGKVVGCGAFVNHRGEYAELKRMYVLPEARGLKIGRRLLEELERRAQAAGLPLARLETGVRQPEALGLYEKAGYRRTGPFGEYDEHPLCVFMEKRLTATWPGGITVRCNLVPGDLGSIVYLHGIVYAREYGFDPTFEAYVAGPLAQFVRASTDRDCLWIAEKDNHIVGSIAIVSASAQEAQLRWFVVDPSARGLGLGTGLLREAVAFCREKQYRAVFLWTVSALTAAARLYRSVGFRKVEENPAEQWGVKVVEEKYVIALD
jgi:putative acetyltransferase